jgi:ribosomal protein S18 acetylase RimI-like enzyme
LQTAEQPIIKLLSENDFGIFWPLRLKALQEEPESFSSDYDEAKLLAEDEVSKRLTSNDEQFALGAFCPDLVGIVGFFRQKGNKVKHQGTIWGMYVLPEFRGLSISRQLMVAAIMYAQEIPELEYLKLTVVTKKQNAFKLYKSLGFEQYGIEPAALKLSGAYLDEALMQLKLHSDPD